MTSATIEEQTPTDQPTASSYEPSVYTEMSPQQQVVVVASQSSVKTPPKFSGSGFMLNEDPLQFVEDFKEAATWNNWSQVSRLKELFYRCLQGLAKEWFSTTVRNMPEYIAGQIPFEAIDSAQNKRRSSHSLRTSSQQGASESAAHYILCKTALYHKANAKGTLDKTKKEKFLDVLPPFYGTTEGAFAKIGIDYIYAPKTAQGNSAALVIIDYLTSWVHAVPVSTQSARSTCLVLFDYICQYGCPDQIIADNGAHFTAIEIQQYMKNTFGIHINFGPPHRPQRQGKVERANRTLKSILKKYLWEYVSDWGIFLPAALFIMKTMVKLDGVYSPFVLTYGQPPRMSALENEDLMQLDEESSDEDALMKRIEELVRLNRNVLPEATSKMNLYKIKMKAQYDKTAKIKKFKVHDMVMVQDNSVIRDGQTLIPKWLGPFTVKERCAKDTYIIQDQFLTLPHPYHADQLKLYKTRPKIYLPLNINLCQNPLVNGG